MKIKDNLELNYQERSSSEDGNSYFKIEDPHIRAVIRKLSAEGVTQQNYNKEEAVGLLRRCIARTRLVRTLENNEKLVIECLYPDETFLTK